MEKKILPPPVVTIKENTRLKNKNINARYYKKVAKFEAKIGQNSNFSLDIYNHNIAHAKIFKDPHPYKNTSSYDSCDNIVSINKDFQIFHELFHLFSTFDTDDVTYAGFSQQQWSNKFYLGTGLNEGYTQVLTKRYFFNSNILYGYYYEAFIASLLEDIISQDYMENLYSKANLYELIEILNYYESYSNILTFLKACDFINAYYHKYKNFAIFNSLFTSKFQYILNFLYNLFYEVEKVDLLDGTINEIERQKEINSYQNRILKLVKNINLNISENKIFTIKKDKIKHN